MRELPLGALEVGRARARRPVAPRRPSSCRSRASRCAHSSTNWGYGVELTDVLTLDNFRSVFDEPTHVRAIWNTMLIGTVGGAIAVACYTAIGFATHRRNDGWSRFVDYLVLVPRADAGTARRPRVPVGVPVLPAADAAAHDDLQHVARLHASSGSPTACG